jgi:hypothetical protein
MGNSGANPALVARLDPAEVSLAQAIRRGHLAPSA